MKPAPKTINDPARSAQMARVRSKNTKPELRVRKALHAAGLRFRLHRRDLPGSPDIVLPSRRAAIFVHGCFWHRHPNPNCKLARLPKSRLEFWEPKLSANRARDAQKERALELAGWNVLVIWECDLSVSGLLDKIVADCAALPRFKGTYTKIGTKHEQ